MQLYRVTIIIWEQYRFVVIYLSVGCTVCHDAIVSSFMMEKGIITSVAVEVFWKSGSSPTLDKLFIS